MAILACFPPRTQVKTNTFVQVVYLEKCSQGARVEKWEKWNWRGREKQQNRRCVSKLVTMWSMEAESHRSPKNCPPQGPKWRVFIHRLSCSIEQGLPCTALSPYTGSRIWHDQWDLTGLVREATEQKVRYRMQLREQRLEKRSD